MFCEHALELAVQHLVAAAVPSGWTEEEALVAIANIADDYRTSYPPSKFSGRSKT